MIFFKLAIAVLLPFTAGYTFIDFLDRERRLSFPLKIALSYGMGLGWLSLWMFVLGMTGQTWNFYKIGVPLLIFSFVFWSLLKILPPSPTRTHRQETEHPRRPVFKKRAADSLFYVLSFTYILLNIYYPFWRAANIPVCEFDSVATIAFKAKIFYFEQYLPSLKLLPHPTYPLFVPFVQAWTAFSLGFWSDQWIKIIFPITMVSYLIIQHEFLRLFTNFRWALLGCVLLLSSNFFVIHAGIGYSDFFLMYYTCSAVLLLIMWSLKGGRSFLILSGLFAGIGTFIKLEGTAFLLIHVTLFFIVDFQHRSVSLKKRLRDFLIFFLPGALISSTFFAFKIWNGAVSEGTGIVDKTGLEMTWEKVAGIPQIMEKFLQELCYSGSWNILWFILILSLALRAHRVQKAEIRLILTALLLFFMLYISCALLTYNFIWIAGDLSFTTLSRLILHFYPLAVILIVLLNCSYSIDKLGDKN